MANVINFFKFLEDKVGRKIPFIVKLIHYPQSLSQEELLIPGHLNLERTKATSLPNNLKVKGSLILSKSSITSLPDNLEVGGGDFGGLLLNQTKITSLPDNLKVNGSLYLDDSKINSIPNNLQVTGTITFPRTPLSDKYTAEQLRQIIKDKGGFVKGPIYDYKPTK
jgi:hypothetical protein